MKKMTFTRQDGIILLLILIVALAFRLQHFSTPLADWHSWRQVDTAAVARNFVNDGFDLMHPRFDDLSNGQTGEYNPDGLRFVEFPIYNALFAGMFKIAPVMPLERYGRLTTIVFSLFAISVVYYLLRKEASRASAIAGAGIYSVMPFFVYYSRVVLPDPTAVSSVFIAIFFLYKWSETKSKSKRWAFYGLSLIFAMVAILVKPVAIFYYLVLAYIFFRKYNFSLLKHPEFYAYFILAVLPFGLWRYWISLFPVGGPGFEWLITSVNTFEGQKVIFMRPAFFRWVFYERILLLIMGGWASLFVLLGSVRKVKRPWLMYSIGVSALLYLMVFQGGNVQHDYYQIMIFPALAIFAGLGIGLLYDIHKELISRGLLTLVILGVIGFSAGMSQQEVGGMYGISESLISTAAIIDTITPKDALIVTDTFGDTTLLYNAKRKGMPALADTLPNLKERGMDYFVTSSEGEISRIADEHPEIEIIFVNDNVTIFKL